MVKKRLQNCHSLMQIFYQIRIFFFIFPYVISLKSTAKGSFALKWKQDKKATGYIIQYSTDKRFEKNVKSTTVSSNRTTSKKIGKLKAGKKYYVRICSYKKSCGKNIKGAYSDVKTVITKK